MKKKLTLYAIISILVFYGIVALFFVIVSVYYKMIPDNFSSDMLKNSTWSTEDGSIKFSIGEEVTVNDSAKHGRMTYSASGVAKIDGVEYEFFIEDNLYASMVVFVSMDMVKYYEQGGSGDYFDVRKEYFLISAMGSFGINDFSCTVCSYSSILPADTELKFYRTDS